MSLREYYGEAIPRAFWAAIDWALAQGWILSLLLAVGVVVCAGLYAGIRAYRGHHSWQDAMSGIWKAVGDFLLAFVGATVVVVFGLFCWFFINDAPEQIRLLRDAQNKAAQRATDSLAQLSRRVDSLQAQLDDKEKRRKIRIALAQFAQQGIELLAEISKSQNTRLDDTEARDWETRIKEFMTSNMDESYYVRLTDLSDMSKSPQFIKEPQLSFAIWNMLTNIQKIVREFD